MHTHTHMHVHLYMCVRTNMYTSKRKEKGKKEISKELKKEERERAGRETLMPETKPSKLLDTRVKQECCILVNIMSQDSFQDSQEQCRHFMIFFIFLILKSLAPQLPTLISFLEHILYDHPVVNKT